MVSTHVCVITLYLQDYHTLENDCRDHCIDPNGRTVEICSGQGTCDLCEPQGRACTCNKDLLVCTVSSQQEI